MDIKISIFDADGIKKIANFTTFLFILNLSLELVPYAIIRYVPVTYEQSIEAFSFALYVGITCLMGVALVYFVRTLLKDVNV